MPVRSEQDVETAVRARYSEGAQKRVETLCCPVEYDARYLEVIPREILERDYGCGDPSRFVREGETVLDLGSGGGKVCYIAAQIAGPEGRVIGVDWNGEMLDLAERHRAQIAARIGYDNVVFHRGKIQDLRLDYGRVDRYLRQHPARSAADLQILESKCEAWRRRDPMIPDGSVDIILSNCVLNLVKDADKKALFAEMYRVLRRGGRVAISDIVSDETVPEKLKADPELWSGCISGAFREDEFLRAFEEAGFHGVELVKRDEQPWRVLEGIEFRSMTVRAYKGKEGPCLDRNQAVIYRGPWKEVRDDDGHVLRRGERMAVCEKTCRLYTQEPYAKDLIGIEPRQAVAPEEARPFDCSRAARRHPRESKGQNYDRTDLSGESCCGPGGRC